MIAKGVIMAVLAGIAVTGVIPVIAGLVLLAMHKLKASSFWAGVLAYIIAMIVFTVISGIVGAAAALSSGDVTAMTTAEDVPASLTALLLAVMSAAYALSMGICIGACMKKTRTFIGAVSCGLGFGIAYTVTTAFSLLTYYQSFVQINSGEFDKMYSQFVEMGVFDKQTVNMMKETFTKFSVGDAVITVITSIAGLLLFAAAAVFIMRGACSRKLFAGIGVSFAAFAVQFGLTGFIPNAVAAAVVALAIGAAALIFALRMREKVVPPEKPSPASDSFMQSVESAKGGGGEAPQQESPRS